MGNQHDVIISGGGLAGSALGRILAANGIRTLILERERRFRDRVRGEQTQPWGVAEARRLGILDLLRETCGHDRPYFDINLAGRPLGHRDLRATTLPSEPGLNFFHPRMQETLLEAAGRAGADVWRGATVREVRTNGHVEVTVERDGRIEDARAHLVVGADGRSSVVRKAAGFEVRRDPPFLMIAGALADGVEIDEDAGHVYINPAVSQAAAIFPQGKGRARAYAIYPEQAGYRLQGREDFPRFIEESVKAGVPSDVYAGARLSGPLASFDASDAWVDHPYRNGVALIGDAASSNDPSWGQGLSLSLMDARHLGEALLRGDDWDTAGHDYAREHDRYYNVMHEVTRAMTDFFLRSGPEADARRAGALPKIAEDATRLPDHGFSGPDLPWNEELRGRFFGLD